MFVAAEVALAKRDFAERALWNRTDEASGWIRRRLIPHEKARL
jgi:hypothetical protein